MYINEFCVNIWHKNCNTHQGLKEFVTCNSSAKPEDLSIKLVLHELK
jgi:hypothetical protein